MTKQDLINILQEIKEIVEDTEGEYPEDNDNLSKITRLCDNALYDYKIEQSIKKLEQSE